MAHFSTLLGRPVCDAAGHPVGKLVDLIVPADTDYPAIQALVAQPRQGPRVLLPWSDVADLDEGRVRLGCPRDQLDAYTPADHDLFLARQVLEGEQKKFTLAPAGTVQEVIGAERDLATAQNNEVKARAAYAKALIQFEQATGTLLERNHIGLSDAVRGDVARAPNIPGTPQAEADRQR